MSWAASPLLLEAIETRRRQLLIRLGIGVAICVALGPVLQWSLVGAWYALWSGVQLIEALWASRVIRRREGQKASALLALGFVFATNCVFNLIAVAAIRTAEPWTMICGIWVLTGGLLNAIAMSRNSTSVFLVGSAPAALTCAVVVVTAAQQGARTSEIVSILLGAGLLLVAALILRRMGLAAFLEARQASAAKSIFLANMSHEIRTPLHGVLGMAQAMAADELSVPQRERLQIVQRSGQALLALLNDILDLSKIEAGQLELDPTDTDVVAIAREVEDSFRAVCAHKDVVVSLEASPAATGLWRCDPLRVRQILSNLLSNAVKFTERGAIKVDIRHVDGVLEIEVSDSGIGIAPARLKSIFGKFVQADASTTRDFGGTGLGLAISRELAERMGGAILAASEPGKGSTFTVRLPLERVEGVREEERPAPAPSADARGLKVLAAEDHKTNQAVLRVLLAQAGIEAHIVENGQEALDAWSNDDWDLILMDVQMPVMDGPTAVRAIRARERESGRPRVPIIALTANAMRHHVEEYLACGMDALVPKPFEFASLLTAISALVNDPGDVLEAEFDLPRASHEAG